MLPRYHPPGHDGVVINVYANLCSSTKYMLKYLPPRIKRGTLINFGGMDHLDHELWAFEQLTSQNSIKFRPVCADSTLARVSFECTSCLRE